MLNPTTYTPARPEDFIGTARGVASFFQKLIADSQAHGHTPIKLLLNGPPGVGKSELVKYLQTLAGVHPKWSTSKYNGTQVKLETIEDITASLHYRDLYGAYRLLWVDEADKIPPTAQIRFLTLLDDLPSGIIVACTSNCQLSEFEARFQSRFIVQEIKAVPAAEIETLLTRFVPDQPAAVRHIATFACGNVRQALLDAKGLMLSLARN